jgi:hypothetical protein
MAVHPRRRGALLSVVAVFITLSLTGAASAASACASLPPPDKSADILGQALKNFQAGLNPEAYEQQQRLRAARATYDALLAAGAPETLACAAALNPDVLRAIAPTYFERPSR